MEDGLGPLQDLRPGRDCRDECSPSLPEVTVGAKSLFWFQAPLGLGCPEEGMVLWREAGAACATFWELPGVWGPRNPRDMNTSITAGVQSPHGREHQTLITSSAAILRVVSSADEAASRTQGYL